MTLQEHEAYDDTYGVIARVALTLARNVTTVRDYTGFVYINYTTAFDPSVCTVRSNDHYLYHLRLCAI